MLKKAVLTSIAIVFLFGVFFLGNRVFAQGIQADPTPPPGATEQPVSCVDADSYLKAGDLILARQAYAAIATSQPLARCALVGLNHLAATEAAKPPAPGTLSPTFTLVPTVTPSPTPNATAIARLEQIGAPEDAWTELKTAIKNNPSNADLILLTHACWARWQRIQAWWTQYGKPIITIVFVAVLLGIAILWWIQKRKLYVDIDCFKYGSMKFDEKASFDPDQALVTAFENSMNRFCRTEGLKRPDLIDQPLAAFDVPTFSSVGGQMGDILNFINKLLPANTISLKGTLEYDEKKGAGLSIRLVHENRLIDCYEVWQRQPAQEKPRNKKKATPVLADYIQLTDEATIRAIWAIYKHIKPDYRRVLRSVFGTDNVESYLDFMEAQDGSLHLSPTRKEILLRRALAHDPKNHIALLDLGNLTGHYRYYNEASDLSKHLNPHPTFVAANYSMGIKRLEAYLDSRDDHERPAFLEKAQSHLAQAWKVARSARRKNKKVISSEYLLMVKIPYIDVLWWESEEKKDPLAKDIQAVEAAFLSPDATYPEARVLYNLASHFSMAVECGKLDRACFTTALKYLKIAFRSVPGYRQYAVEDRALKTLRDQRKKEFNGLLK